MKNLFALLIFSFSVGVCAQVGIGTTTPGSTLDVVAANPTGLTTTVDGILIPRVTRERAKAMLTVPTSTIVYVTEVVTGTATGTAVNITAIGFYYYNGTVWVALGGAGVSDHDWYKFGTTTAPTAITDDMFHTGDVSIGKNTASASKLDISENLAARTSVVNVTHTIPAITTGEIALLKTTTNLTLTPTDGSPTNLIGLRNDLLGTGADAGAGNFHNRYGVYNNLSSPTLSGFYWGMYNRFDSTNANGNVASKTGVYNSFICTNPASSAEVSGLYNDFNFAVSSLGNPTYGVRNEINAAGPTFYGLRNNFAVSGATGAAPRYGVYNSFLGRRGTSYGMYNITTNNETASTNYGVRTDISSTGGTGTFYGEYVSANGITDAGQWITGIYAEVPGGNSDPGAGIRKRAAEFNGPVHIYNGSVARAYILPLEQANKANAIVAPHAAPVGGQVILSTTTTGGKKTEWSPFVFQNNAATSIIAKYYVGLSSAMVWNNGETRVFTINDADCRTNSSISVSFTNGTVAAADDFIIESISTTTGQFYITATNVSGANIAGGFNIPVAFTALY